MFFAVVDMSELATLLTAVFTAFGALLFGFYKYAQAREKDFEKSRSMAAKEYDKSTKALSKALNRVAIATEKSASEAKERNGHLAELAVKNAERMMEALAIIRNQAVDTQHVETQIIENSGSEK